jgi:hypothetical protein
MDRREILGGGLAAGLSGLFADPAVAGQRADAPTGESAAVRAIETLRQAIEGRDQSVEISQIRAQQRAFLKSNQKFPDFIDVGIDVWERLHDWHVRTLQPVTVIRTADGHYGMSFVVTTLILQPQQAGTYISWGYDSR